MICYQLPRNGTSPRQPRSARWRIARDNPAWGTGGCKASSSAWVPHRGLHGVADPARRDRTRAPPQRAGREAVPDRTGPWHPRGRFRPRGHRVPATHLRPDRHRACTRRVHLTDITANRTARGRHKQRAKAICERMAGTLRRELFDRSLLVNEYHLRRVLTEYLRHYNTARPHRALGQLGAACALPFPAPLSAAYLQLWCAAACRHQFPPAPQVHPQHLRINTELPGHPGSLPMALSVPLPDLGHNLHHALTQLVGVLRLCWHDSASSQGSERPRSPGAIQSPNATVPDRRQSAAAERAAPLRLWRGPVSGTRPGCSTTCVPSRWTPTRAER